ncbi:MAG: hypothetical protein PHH71_03360 [Clostridia bacterium]|jgi:hypothetical protein|nr:hypothetical protein [Clostridia bacterium]MDD3232350.1 hypothetical protein [Clostridia bacterium]MDD3862680.1 hypothetical protein [Clostridia bacterium]
MSFYINNSNPNRPGVINSSALNSICEKVLIEVNKVFDACMTREENDPYILTVSNFNPANPTFPLNFITVDSIPNQPATIVSANIERLENKPNFANVTVNFSIPLQVNYTDANGVSGTASSTLNVTRTSVLFVPQDSLSPIQVSAFAFFSSQIGTFTDNNTLSVTGCLQVIIKIVALVDLLIPSFGYPCLPPCHEIKENASACPSFINQPIYPGTR